jgi:RNA polymerase sigma-70 factor (ECF subfamily)
MPDSEAALVARLRAGDRAAFALLVREHHTRLVRLAMVFARSRGTAEEVVQDAWVAVITGIAGFSGAAPIRAWLSGIVVNKARTRAVRDGRSVSFEDLGGPAVDPSRFAADGHWLERFGPSDWLTPERIAGDRQLLDRMWALLDTLPEAQRAVILLRDVEGMEPARICAELGIGDGNFRVLLHRGRAKLRDAAAALLEEPGR